MQRNKIIIVKELAQTVGNLEAPFKSVSLGQLFYRHLGNCNVESLRRTHGDFGKHAFISTEAKIELKWWKESLESSSATIKVEPLSYTIYSDTNLEPWGGTDREIEIGGR